MRVKDYDALRDQLRELADHLGLRDWKLKLDRAVEKDDECYATTQVAGEQKKATIHLHRHFFKLPKKKQRWVLLHELMHCWLDPLVAQADFQLRESLKKGERKVAHNALVYTSEYIVDELAVAINELMR